MARKSIAELLNGQTRFASLTVIADAGCKTEHSYRFVRCRCDCGSEWETRLDGIRRGLTTSCGCLSRARAKTLASETCTTHGDAKTGAKSAEYRIHAGMLKRCYKENDPKYPLYGGRGILVTDEWRGRSGYQQFLADMGRRPSRSHSLDRRDNNGGYCAANCRWATKTEQARNQRTNRIVVYCGEAMTLAEAADRSGITAETIAKRIRRGWSEQAAMSIPAKAS